MSKGTLSTLDFVIGVLREHEKELTELSDKLEEIIADVSGHRLKKDMDEIQSAIEGLGQKIQVLEQNIIVTGSLNSTIEVTIKQLVEQTSIQNQSIKLFIEAMKEYPTKKEIRELTEGISSLNASLKKTKSQPSRK